MVKLNGGDPYFMFVISDIFFDYVMDAYGQFPFSCVLDPISDAKISWWGFLSRITFPILDVELSVENPTESILGFSTTNTVCEKQCGERYY